MDLNKSKNIKFVQIPIAQIGVMLGLLELIDDNGGKMDIYQLGRDLMLETDDIFPNIEGLSILELSEVKEGDIFITGLGKKFVDMDKEDKKVLFKNQIEKYPHFV